MPPLVPIRSNAGPAGVAAGGGAPDRPARSARCCWKRPVRGIGGFPAMFADLFLCLMTVGLILPNATAAVMAPYPHQAGVASALLGMLQFSVGAATGALVGLFHDGPGRPMAFTMASCAAISLVITLASERMNKIHSMSVAQS